jgi:MFS family permease
MEMNGIMGNKTTHSSTGSTSLISGVMDNSSCEKVSTEAETAYELMFDKLPGLSRWRRSLIFFGLCFGLLLSLMDTSIMATAIYTISLDFDSLASTLWAILGYQLSYLGFAVIFARLSDFIGRRSAVILAFVLFVGFSLGCGWAKNVNLLVLFRTLQGIGGAGLYALALILLIEISTARMVTFTSALIGAIIAVAGVLGPIIGGLFTQYVSWRWIFWLNGPCGLFAGLCFVIGWPNQTLVYDRATRKWYEFDGIGAILLLAASVLVVLGIQQGGNGSYAWSSGYVIGTLVVGSLCWILLILWEYYVFKTRRLRIASIFPFELLIHRPMLAGILSTILIGFILYLTIISLILHFQIVNLKSPSTAGVYILPLLCACGLGSFVAGAVSSKKNYIFQTFFVASSLMMIGVGLFFTLGSQIPIQEGKCFGFEVILGFAIGLTFSSMSLMTSLETEFKLHAVAQGIVAQVRVLGGSIGVAASNAMFNATCAKTLQGILTPEQIQGLQTNTQILGTLDEAVRQAVRVAYSDSFNKSLRVCLVVAAVNLVINLFTWKGKRASVRAGSSKVQGDEEV